MGRRARPWGRAGRVTDADGCCFCLTVDALACSCCFPRLTGWVFELQDQFLVCQYLWFVLRHGCLRCRLLAGLLSSGAGVLHLVRLLG